MIAHFSYMLCDGPVNPAYHCAPGELFDTAAEARRWGRRAGWARIDGKDLCPECAKRQTSGGVS